jgi:hypothetical protein
LNKNNGFLPENQSLDTSQDALNLVQGVLGKASLVESPFGFINNSYNSDKTPTLPVYKLPSKVAPGLAKAVRSIRKRESRLDMLRFCQLNEEEVYGLFKEAIDKNSDYWLVLRDSDNSKTDVVCVPSSSRWNLKKGQYKKRVYGKFKKELRDLKKACLLTLTYAPKIVRSKNPYPYLDDRTFVILHCWDHLDKFLDRLRKYMVRKGYKWSYIGAVTEFQQNGMIHFHLVFFGAYIAPLPVLQTYWEWSEPQGVDVGFRENINVASYLCKYLTKANKCLDADKVHTGYAWVYFFGVHLYNLRHHYRFYLQKRKSNYVCIGLAFVGDGEWKGQIDITFKRFDDAWGNSEHKWWDDSS